MSGASIGAHEDIYFSSSHWFPSKRGGGDTTDVEANDDALSTSTLYFISGNPILLK